MDLLTSAPERLKSFRVSFPPREPEPLRTIILQETRLSALRPVTEFFDHHRISRPADMNQATSVRYFFRVFYSLP